jgi:hypothetical protein
MFILTPLSNFLNTLSFKVRLIEKRVFTDFEGKETYVVIFEKTADHGNLFFQKQVSHEEFLEYSFGWVDSPKKLSSCHYKKNVIALSKGFAEKIVIGVYDFVQIEFSGERFIRYGIIEMNAEFTWISKNALTEIELEDFMKIQVGKTQVEVDISMSSK